MKKIISKIKNYFINKFVKPATKANFAYEELTVNIPALYSFSRIVEAMEIIKVYNSTVIPVVNINQEIIGYVNDRDIAHLVGLQTVLSWSSLKDYTIDTIVTESTLVKTWQSNLEDIVGEFTEKNIEIISVVNEENKYTGYCITSSKLISYTSNSIKPRAIGGLATPLGVYLTDGYNNGGAGIPGLVLTGVTFAIVINAISIITYVFLGPYNLPESVILVTQLVLFLLALRISPLVGYHAAEHQTIHAIEKGLDLTLENIKKQPKEHDRCGTNFMILFLGLSLLFLISLDFWKNLGVLEHTVLLIVFSSIIIINWKKMGVTLQKVFTTTKANEKQLMSGLKAGQQLLDHYQNNTEPVRLTFVRKIWNMGIVQVLISFIAISFVIQYLITLLWPIKFVCDTIFLYV